MNKKMICRLMEGARVARVQAYAPYSGFRVGAAILCKSGRIFAATNVENASYGLTMCAERNALAKAIAEGERDFIALAVVGRTNAEIVPCGACCQVLAEFCERGFRLYVGSQGTEPKSYKLSTLLPCPFKHRASVGKGRPGRAA